MSPAAQRWAIVPHGLIGLANGTATEMSGKPFNQRFRVRNVVLVHHGLGARRCSGWRSGPIERGRIVPRVASFRWRSFIHCLQRSPDGDAFIRAILGSDRKHWSNYVLYWDVPFASFISITGLLGSNTPELLSGRGSGTQAST
jgi:hypothetical protein